ncbi:redoxin domain-containing protein [Pedobacter chitinilyticus]|uniref:Redoxin domain-containing protein n=1 Tax=Pedobacter chitinilyticus TaxID=2233776 RepID=A0A443YRE3_9SPHI|nr:redoxin domain-containing protein [Pedobacter chitinilyticus]RWU06380.1 redoxin domain-containing protein [Pedobacter chitinilyticus]
MKKIILSALLLAPVALMAQSDFTLKGTTKSVANGNKVYLVYAENGQRLTDSAIVSNGSFEFKGKVTAPVMGNLFNNVNPYKKGANTRNMDYTALYIEPGNITINSADSLKSGVAGGTQVNIDNAKLNALLKPFTEKEKALNDEYSKFTKEQKEDEAFMDAFMEKYNAVRDQKTPVYLGFVKNNPKSYISMVQLASLASNDKVVGEVEKLYAALSPELKATKTGQNIPKTIDATKKTAVGVAAMDFTQNDPNGKAVKLSDFKGKYVLIDFWASWCGPCRNENPNVVEAFNKFKDKNFTILGVSLDGGNTRTTKEQWLKAVEDDKLAWTQVSDMQGWNNEVSTAWGIRSIPANFLVDPNGKIVAKDLRGGALHKKLAELLDKKTK